MTGSLYSLFRRNLTTRARLLSFGIAAAAIVTVGAVVGSGDSVEPAIEVAAEFATEAVLSLFLPIAALVFAASAFGDLIEDRTLVYIWLRPIRRVVIVVAALLASVTVVAPLSWLTALAGASLIDSSSELMLGVTAAALVGALAYSSIFLLLGYVSRRPLLWGLAYLIIWEEFISRAGKGLNATSISGHLHSIVADLGDTPLDRADFSLTTAIAVPVMVSIVALGLLTWRLARGDVD